MRPESPLDLADYDFELPPEQIAQQPAEKRDGARLLHLNRSTGQIQGEHHVPELVDLLEPGDLLVVNATRVLSARLKGQKSSGGNAEALLLEPDPLGPTRTYRALIKTGGRLREGLEFSFGEDPHRIRATLTALHSKGEASLTFDEGPDPLSLGEAP
ncbi:S-adenosylmethionine:tRNA ribosyltransferase-isomerase, partial [Myxococcota bacterium]|nr:S-adenosylmethionine:tRNA ribosyltransferase-isomerase [Myxococcota bacterium]